MDQTIRYIIGFCALVFMMPTAYGQNFHFPKRESNEPSIGVGWYQVTAPSGLVLRVKPDRNATKISTVPYQEEVYASGITGEETTIEGKKGHWHKVVWAEQEGYLFGGFLQPQAHTQIQMFMPNSGMENDWEYATFDPKLQWNALVNLDASHRYDEFERLPQTLGVTQLTLGKKKFNAGTTDEYTLDSTAVNVHNAPFLVFSGFNIPDTVRNSIASPVPLFPGKTYSLISFDRALQATTHYTFAATGNAVGNTQFSTSQGRKGPVERIEQYKVTLYQRTIYANQPQDHVAWTTQALASGTRTQPTDDTDSDEIAIDYLYFAGDLDGDKTLDFIIYRSGGITWSYHLYLSSKKLPGFLTRWVAFAVSVGD